MCSVQAKASNHHGWQAYRAHGVNQERGVSNIVLGTKDVSSSQFMASVYKMGQLQVNAYQLAPSAWTAAAACHTIETDYKEVAPANSLMELEMRMSTSQRDRGRVQGQMPQRNCHLHGTRQRGCNLC